MGLLIVDQVSCSLYGWLLVPTLPLSSGALELLLGIGEDIETSEEFLMLPYDVASFCRVYNSKMHWL